MVSYQQPLVLLESKIGNFKTLFNSPKNVKADGERTLLRDGMYSFHPNSYKTKPK